MPKQRPSAHCLCPEGPCGIPRRLALSSYRRCPSSDFRAKAKTEGRGACLPSSRFPAGHAAPRPHIKPPVCGSPARGHPQLGKWPGLSGKLSQPDPGAGRSKCSLGCDSHCPTVMHRVSEDGGVCGRRGEDGGGGQGEEKKSNLNESKEKGLGRDRSQRTHFK